MSLIKVLLLVTLLDVSFGRIGGHLHRSRTRFHGSHHTRSGTKSDRHRLMASGPGDTADAQHRVFIGDEAIQSFQDPDFTMQFIDDYQGKHPLFFMGIGGVIIDTDNNPTPGAYDFLNLIKNVAGGSTILITSRNPNEVDPFANPDQDQKRILDGIKYDENGNQYRKGGLGEYIRPIKLPNDLKLPNTRDMLGHEGFHYKDGVIYVPQDAQKSQGIDYFIQYIKLQGIGFDKFYNELCFMHWGPDIQDVSQYFENHTDKPTTTYQFIGTGTGADQQMKRQMFK